MVADPPSVSRRGFPVALLVPSRRRSKLISLEVPLTWWISTAIVFWPSVRGVAGKEKGKKIVSSAPLATVFALVR